ncbi:pseudouridylate synthase RPUSD4, mitochondrial-like [Osmerus mordax]|uniref:pseudouridylate synthase RPUSD4, mitochondrial-like n=1 Tax=Osmerus mordax TaxID=8014 RepID=UPI00350EDE3D
MNSYSAVSFACNHDLSHLSKMLNCLIKTRIRCCVSPGVASMLARTHVTAPKKQPSGPDPENKPPLRAIDLAQKIRREKAQAEKTSIPKSPVSPLEKSVLELRQLSQQLQNVHPNVLAKHLHKSIIFQNQELIVINKPYGVPVQEGSAAKNCIYSVLPILAKMMDGMKGGSQLHTCIGLDKEITGALLLARNEEVANHIQELHKHHQVERKYLVVSVGVPVPSEGVIDIPVIEREVTGSQPHFKMGLSPVYRMSDSGEGVTRVRAHRQAHGAVTKYRVLESSNGCSLVELQPITGVKHQMRVHMAYALGCPIIGDHKYAHWNKLAPQRLPDAVLKRLGIQQSKVRYLPLHLHARQLTLPGFRGQDDISVSCPLTRFFVSTLRKLQISLPDYRTDETL